MSVCDTGIKRIIYHWTAGTYKVNATDRQHYHFIIDDDGEVTDGIFKPEANLNCLDGRYAAHTGGCNTGSIGIAFAGMYDYKSPFNIGKYPLTAKQCEAGFKLGAELVKKYSLYLPDPFVIQTHYGFGKRNPRTSSAGKIDIIYLPPFPDIKADEIETFIKNKITWYFERL